MYNIDNYSENKMLRSLARVYNRYIHNYIMIDYITVMYDIFSLNPSIVD